MLKVRQWITAEEGRHNLWEYPLIAYCVVDEQGNPLFRASELNFGTFDDWDVRVVYRLGAAIREFTGVFQD